MLLYETVILIKVLVRKWIYQTAPTGLCSLRLNSDSSETTQKSWDTFTQISVGCRKNFRYFGGSKPLGKGRKLYKSASK